MIEIGIGLSCPFLCFLEFSGYCFVKMREYYSKSDVNKEDIFRAYMVPTLSKQT